MRSNAVELPDYTSQVVDVCLADLSSAQQDIICNIT